MLPNDSVDIAYRLPNGRWHRHSDVDAATAAITCRMLDEMGRAYKVRHNATGQIEGSSGPLTLLHLFYNRISDRNGSGTAL